MSISFDIGKLETVRDIIAFKDEPAVSAALEARKKAKHILSYCQSLAAYSISVNRSLRSGHSDEFIAIEKILTQALSELAPIALSLPHFFIDISDGREPWDI